MLRLPDAVLQHIVSLVVSEDELSWADDAKKKKEAHEQLMITLKTTCKAMKRAISNHVAQKKRVAFKVYQDLFHQFPTLPLIAHLKFEIITKEFPDYYRYHPVSKTQPPSYQFYFEYLLLCVNEEPYNQLMASYSWLTFSLTGTFGSFCVI